MEETDPSRTLPNCHLVAISALQPEPRHGAENDRLAEGPQGLQNARGSWAGWLHGNAPDGIDPVVVGLVHWHGRWDHLAIYAAMWLTYAALGRIIRLVLAR